MKTITSTIKAVSLFLLWATANIALADAAGNVVRVNGSATAKDPSGQSRALGAGDVVSEGDVIDTTSGSAIQLQMKDGALLALTGESSLRIQVYNFEETNGDKDRIQLQLNKGRFRTITGDVPKTSYNLSTPSAMVKVKGTTYDELVNGEKTTTILRGGAVTVETICEGKGTGSIQLLDVPGDAVAVSAPCRDPETVEDVDVTDLDDILPVPETDTCTTCGPPDIHPPGSASP